MVTVLCLSAVAGFCCTNNQSDTNQTRAATGKKAGLSMHRCEGNICVGMGACSLGLASHGPVCEREPADIQT